jgi:hypothetical protein
MVSIPTWEDKWSRTRLVWTDKQEKTLSSTTPAHGKSVLERYVYYYSYDDVEQLLHTVFARRPTVTITSLGSVTRFNKTYQINAVHVTSPLISTTEKKHILFMGVIHAREPASLNVNLAYLDQLSANINQAFTDVLTHSVAHFILLVNPCGYTLDRALCFADTGAKYFRNQPGRMYRKNGHGGTNRERQILTRFAKTRTTADVTAKQNFGVDLNRNFGAIPDNVPDLYRMDLTQNAETLSTRYDLELVTIQALQALPDKEAQLARLQTHGLWGLDDLGSSPDPREDTYRGPSPNSELETQCVEKVMLDYPLCAHVMHHAYGNQILHANRPRVVHGRAYLTAFTRACTAECTKMARHLAVIGDANDGLRTNRDLRSDILTYSVIDDSIGYPVNGDTDDFGYLVHASRRSRVPYIGVTVETGNGVTDLFYPSECEMIDLVANGLTFNQRVHAYICKTTP